RGDGGLPLGVQGRAAQSLVVGGRQRALGHDHQDGPGPNAGVEQAEQAGHASGGLASAGRPFQEDLALDGTLNEGALVVRKRDSCHTGGDFLSARPHRRRSHLVK
ncbi:MAG: hypothetical protein MUP90_17635, partial [Gammaproteobacteria bacterium]|nr:hypothetical protein [Gammaproteobacteria bacterium]